MALRLIHEELLRAGPLYLSPWQPTCCLDTTRCYLFPLDQTEPGSKDLCLLGKARGGLVRCMMSAFTEADNVQARLCPFVLLRVLLFCFRERSA